MNLSRWLSLLACLSLLVTLGGSQPAHAADDKEAKSGSVRVYRFDNLDVEGKVKAPQLMYFLKRIRSKFRSFRLPKQNFTKKIVESKDAPFL